MKDRFLLYSFVGVHGFLHAQSLCLHVMHDTELICYLMIVRVCNKIKVEWYAPSEHVILDSDVFMCFSSSP